MRTFLSALSETYTEGQKSTLTVKKLPETGYFKSR